MADNDTEIVNQTTDSRLTEYSPKVIGDLIVAFHSDYTIEAACRYAGVSRTSYYEWLKVKEGFAEKMNDAQNKLLQKASEVVSKSINEGDANLAFKFLQTRDPRYKAKASIEVSKGQEDYERIAKEFANERDELSDFSTEPVGNDSTEN